MERRLLQLLTNAVAVAGESGEGSRAWLLGKGGGGVTPPPPPVSSGQAETVLFQNLCQDAWGRKMGTEDHKHARLKLQPGHQRQMGQQVFENEMAATGKMSCTNSKEKANLDRTPTEGLAGCRELTGCGMKTRLMHSLQ